MVVDSGLLPRPTSTWRSRLKRHRLLSRVWSRYRAWEQERQIRAEQGHYNRLVDALGLPHEFDEAELRGRLAARLATRGLVLRPKTDFHFVYAAPLTHTWAENSMPRGLSELGRLTSFLLEEQGFADRGVGWVNRRPLLDSTLIDFVKAANAAQPVDLFVGYLGGADIAPGTIHAINEMGIPTCGIWMDDRLYFRGAKLGGRYVGSVDLASAYDLNLTNASASIAKYLAEGGLAMFWPEAGDPDLLRPLDLPFEYDVSFVGACYGQRPALLDYLCRGGIRVEAFGPGWPNGPLTPEAMVETYAKSRINLGMSGVGYSMKELCLKGRDFEVPMCGAVYLANDQPDLQRVFNVGVEVIAYTDERDCLRKISHLLAYPEECSRIRQAVRQRCQRDHTWAGRFREVLRTFGMLEPGQDWVVCGGVEG